MINVSCCSIHALKQMSCELSLWQKLSGWKMICGWPPPVLFLHVCLKSICQSSLVEETQKRRPYGAFWEKESLLSLYRFTKVQLLRCTKNNHISQTSKEGTSVYKTAFLDDTVVRGELYWRQLLHPTRWFIGNVFLSTRAQRLTEYRALCLYER